MLDDTFLICPVCKETLSYVNFIHSGKLGTEIKNKGGLCNLCLTIKQNAYKVKNSLVCSIVYTERIQNEIDLGLRKKCIKCLRYNRLNNLNVNGICKSCLTFFITNDQQFKFDKQLRLNALERKELLNRELNLSCSEKEQKQNLLDLKIQDFLLKEKNV